MFSLFKKPLDERLFQDIWEIPGNCEKLIPIDPSNPRDLAAFQAVTALANLAIVCAALFITQDKVRATQMTKALERRVASAVSALSFRYPVTQILKLPSEQEAWRDWCGQSAEGTNSSLETILNVVWAQRLNDYQCDLIRGMELARSGEFNVYGPVVFLTKRYLSHRSGIVIDPHSRVPEKGLEHFVQHNYYLTAIFQAVSSYAEFKIA